MEDRELLELAAKAAGMHANQWAEAGELVPGKSGWVQFIGLGQACLWNPLEDNGDAFRLAVKLRLDLIYIKPLGEDSEEIVDIYFDRDHIGPCHRALSFGLSGDSDAVVRTAIVRAAAEIGAGM